MNESGFLTLDLKARRILGRKRTKHFRMMVTYLSTKSVMPTAQIRSKKSKLLRMGLANMRLEEENKMNQRLIVKDGVAYTSSNDKQQQEKMSEHVRNSVETKQQNKQKYSQDKIRQEREHCLKEMEVKIKRTT